MDPWVSLVLAFKSITKHGNCSFTSNPYNKVQGTIRSSKLSRGENEIKKTLQVSLLVLSVGPKAISPSFDDNKPYAVMY